MAIFRTSLAAALFCARTRYAANCGMAMAARIPMMATTIISSIRVKPFWPFFLFSCRLNARNMLPSQRVFELAGRHRARPAMFCLLPFKQVPCQFAENLLTCCFAWDSFFTGTLCPCFGPRTAGQALTICGKGSRCGDNFCQRVAGLVTGGCCILLFSEVFISSLAACATGTGSNRPFAMVSPPP